MLNTIPVKDVNNPIYIECMKIARDIGHVPAKEIHKRTAYASLKCLEDHEYKPSVAKVPEALRAYRMANEDGKKALAHERRNIFRDNADVKAYMEHEAERKADNASNYKRLKEITMRFTEYNDNDAVVKCLAVMNKYPRGYSDKPLPYTA